jgi:hypothetical protein
MPLPSDPTPQERERAAKRQAKENEAQALRMMAQVHELNKTYFGHMPHMQKTENNKIENNEDNHQKEDSKQEG